MNFLHSFLQQIGFGVNTGLLQSWDFLVLMMSLLVKRGTYLTEMKDTIQQWSYQIPQKYVYLCLRTDLCLCIYTYGEALISCFFLSGANCVVCSVLCSFCIWSLWTLGTNSSTSSNPAASVQPKMEAGAVDSIAGSHIFLSLFPTHSYSFLIIFNQWDRRLLMWLCMFSLWLHLILHTKGSNLHCIFSTGLQTHLQSFPLPQGPGHFLVSVDLFSASGCLLLIVWLGTHRHFQTVGSWAISPPPHCSAVSTSPRLFLALQVHPSILQLQVERYSESPLHTDFQGASISFHHS